MLLLRRLRNEHIAAIDRVFCTANSLYIAMELHEASLENIMQYSNSLLDSYTKVLKLVHQIIRGLSYLHSFRITHGNLSPAHLLLRNFMSDHPKVVLAGFSRARCFDA